MADRDKELSSSNLSFFGLKNTDICLIKSLNEEACLIYDGKHLKWTQDYCGLKNFVENIVCLEGLWKSPGGKSKQFVSTHYNLNMTWYPGKQNSLVFHGRDGESLKELLIGILTNRVISEDKYSEMCDDDSQPAIVQSAPLRKCAIEYST